MGLFRWSRACAGTLGVLGAGVFGYQIQLRYGIVEECQGFWLSHSTETGAVKSLRLSQFSLLILCGFSSEWHKPARSVQPATLLHSIFTSHEDSRIRKEEGRQVHIFSHFCLDGDEELVIRAIRRLGHENIDVVCIAFEMLSKAFEENHFPSFPFLFDNDLEDIEFR